MLHRNLLFDKSKKRFEREPLLTANVEGLKLETSVSLYVSCLALSVPCSFCKSYVKAKSELSGESLLVVSLFKLLKHWRRRKGHTYNHKHRRKVLIL